MPQSALVTETSVNADVSMITVNSIQGTIKAMVSDGR
jgi:hypothetical protein